MFTRTWLKDTGERLVRTFAAALAAFFVADATVLSVDWTEALAVSGTTTFVTLLLAIGATKAGSTGTASYTAALRPNENEVTR